MFLWRQTCLEFQQAMAFALRRTGWQVGYVSLSPCGEYQKNDQHNHADEAETVENRTDPRRELVPAGDQRLQEPNLSSLLLSGVSPLAGYRNVKQYRFVARQGYAQALA
jgi:hypothetical protein